jgi:hypothetical protein
MPIHLFRSETMLHRRCLVLFLLLGILFTGCAPKADFDIRGEWEYMMTTTDGNTYDTGIITFSGEPAQGTFMEINIYQVEYEGEFTVNGSTLNLTGGETWNGKIMDANTIDGTWSHDDGAGGTFVAARK